MSYNHRPFCKDLETRLTLVYNVVGVVNPMLDDKSAFLEHSLLMQSCSWNTIVSNVGGCGKP